MSYIRLWISIETHSMRMSLQKEKGKRAKFNEEGKAVVRGYYGGEIIVANIN